MKHARADLYYYSTNHKIHIDVHNLVLMDTILIMVLVNNVQRTVNNVPHLVVIYVNLVLYCLLFTLNKLSAYTNVLEETNHSHNIDVKIAMLIIA